jgi:HIP---CoA ligase
MGPPEGTRADLAHGTIPSLVRAAAARHGDRPAIVDGDVTLSYRELASAMDATGRGLVALGTRRGDRVAIWGPNGWAWIVAALGVHAAGGALVPLSTRARGPEAAHVLGRSGARVLFAATGFLGLDPVAALREAGHPLPRVLALSGALAGDGPLPDLGGDDLCDVMFTSGTTGAPRGVPGTHAQALRAFGDWADVVGLRAGDRTLVAVPFFHTFGMKAGWLAAFLTGATVYPHAVFDAGEILARVARDRITVLPGPPTLYQSLLARPDLAAADLSSLRLAVTGAAVIPVELVRRMRDELGFATVITGYGLTEATGVVTMCRDGDDAETIATTSGRPIPGVEVQIAGDGEILVRGYNVMSGYLGDPEATAAALGADGWLRTGDIGEFDGRGNLRITDRKKDLFIVGGFNASPAEIEQVLLTHASVAQAAVVGAPDERLGEVGVAFVVPRAGAAAQPEELIRHCRERLSNYKVPRRVEVVDALPQNATGKVSKVALRARVRGST